MRSVPARSTVHLLVNPAARRGVNDAAFVSDRLTAAGYQVERIEPDGTDDVTAAIRRVGPNRVVAVGGDGLVHHALPALVEGEIALGIVPSGTGNDFARALKLPKRRAAATQRSVGPATAVDLLRVEHHDGTESFVATSVTAGFSGRVNATANARTFPQGQLKYTVASLIELRRLEPFDLHFGRLDLGEGEHAPRTDPGGSCSFFAVANTRYFGGGMAIAPKASSTDGLLHLTVVGGVPAWQLAAVLPSVFIGQHVRHPRVTEITATRVDLEHDQEVWADGERIASGSISVSVVPKSLFVAAF